MNKLILTLSVLLDYLFLVKSCNEAICGSVVSKCLLTKSCTCDLQVKSCSKDCFNCLGYLYTECCSCVDMCPKGEDVIDILSKKSHVEDFLDPVPQLFNALTEYPDQLSQWTATVIPMDLKLKTNEESLGKPQQISVNCTVVFWSQCMSWKKCKSGCLSMGASSYRWFHDGCCECIGDECINYGLNESKCKECPIDNILETTVDEYELDYGDEDMADYEEDDE